jgi:hypothetical protein
MSWQQQLRQYQEKQQNAGWRIRLIPFDDKSKPMRYETNWFATAGAIGFIIPFILLISGHAKNVEMLLKIAIGSWLFGLFALWLKARFNRRGWEVGTANCVDRELQKVFTGKGNAWEWRIVCEYEFRGEKYRVTPSVNWMSFSSEVAAHKFIAKRISAGDVCQLRINPRNPLQTELFGQGIKDLLLY